MIRGDEAFADTPLCNVGIPWLEILEVRDAGAARWYELTGDLANFPEAVRPDPAVVQSVPPTEPAPPASEPEAVQPVAEARL